MSELVTYLTVCGLCTGTLEIRCHPEAKPIIAYCSDCAVIIDRKIKERLHLNTGQVKGNWHSVDGYIPEVPSQGD